MKSREINELKKHKCPVYLMFGKSRNWGKFYANNDGTVWVTMFLNAVTPAVFEEYLHHELLHHAIYKVNPGISIHKEHEIIDIILQMDKDWL